MKIIKINTTGGPNYWSIRHHKLVVMELDLEELEHRPTEQIDGFYTRLKEVMPGLYDHQCSEGRAGGFFTRVQEGTWMGHVIEHIALELQTLAELDVGFGRTRGTGTKGHYHVVFACADRESGRLAAKKAVSIAQNIVDGHTKSIVPDVNEIREMNQRYKPGPSTESMLREATARDIPFIKMEESSTYQLGYGCYQHKIAATITSSTSNIAVDLACDKQACRRLFNEMRIPVAEGGVASSHKDLNTLIDELGFPLVVKPISGNQGRGVTTNIQTANAALKAFKAASDISEGVIVERHINGNDYRLLTVNHKLAAASKRTPAHVRGDGTSTIKQLIEAVNSNPRRGDGHNKALTKIEVGQGARTILKGKGYSLSTVLPEGEVLYLHHAANLSKGGTAQDITETLHPEVITMAERISRIVDLDICGIDVMAGNVEQPLSKTGGVILEINAAPGFRMHLSPSKGEPQNVAAPVLHMLFSDEPKSRIPITAVTGTNGKTTTTRLISHILKESGRHVGYTTTDGIYIDGQRMMKGDCGGPKSAEFVLRDPTVDTAVLECARGGILREGLGFDRCDVGVVTNVSSDHLGLKGINTIEKMARVKSVVPETVPPNGSAVLNADDDHVYAMRERLQCQVVLFSMNANNLRLRAHRKNGGLCVTCKEGDIIIWDGDATYTVEEIKNIPLSFGGTANFMVENIMAAVAASYTQGIAVEDISKSLAGFSASPEQAPGRMNLFNFDDFDVMIDYAHNAAGLKAIQQFISQSIYQHTVGIVAAIGDRRPQDNREIGRIAAEVFDTIIIREDADLRGRVPGEVTKMIKKGIKSSDCNPTFLAIANEKKALSYAIKNAKPGSLILHCTDKVDDVLNYMNSLRSKFNSYKPSTKIKNIDLSNFPPA